MNTNFHPNQSVNQVDIAKANSTGVTLFNQLSLTEQVAYFKQAHLRHTIKQLWKAHAKTKQATAAQNVARCLLLGKNLDRSFTPLQRESKITGYAGGNPHIARDEAVQIIKVGVMSAFKPWQELLNGLETQYGTMYKGGWEAIVRHLELPSETLALPARGEPHQGAMERRAETSMAQDRYLANVEMMG